MKSRRERRKLERQVRAQKVKLSPEEVVNRIKYSLNSEQQRAIKNKLREEEKFDLLFDYLPKSISDLRKKGVTYPNNNLFKEILWYTEEVIDFQEDISLFIKLEDNFENRFIAGDYNLSKSYLDEIGEICFSEWYLESKLLFTEYSSGFNLNKELAAQLLGESNNPLTNLFVKYYSIKVEKELSHFKYDEIIADLLVKYSGSAKEYLLFKLNLFNLKRYDSLGFFLNIDNLCSIVDKYKNLITVFQIVMSTDYDKEIKKLVLDACKKIYKVIKDYRVRNIILFNLEFDDFEVCENEKVFNNILDHYSKGEYDIALSTSKKLLLDDANSLNNYILYCKSIMYECAEFENPFPLKSLAFQILNSVYNVLVKNDKYYSSIISLHKIINVLSFTSLGRELYNFILDESPVSNNEASYSINPNYVKKYLNPLMINITSENESYIVSNLSDKLDSSTFRFFKDLMNLNDFNEILQKNIDNIDEYRVIKYFCKKLESLKRFDQLFSYLGKLSTNDKFLQENKISFNSIEISNLKISYYSFKRDYNNIINIIARKNIENAGLSIRLNHKEILDIIIKGNDESVRENIATPIVLYQYNKIISNNEIWIALDNILDFYEVNYPSQLIDKIRDYDKDLLIYFFYIVCVQEIYDSSIWFENQEALDLERMEILSILSDLDKDNIDLYFKEISELDRDLLIKKGIKQIDESKIYVDTQGLKNSLFKSLEESLQRSLKLQNLSIDQLDKLDIDENFLVVPYFENMNSPDDITTGADIKNSNIKITSYSRFEHFREMFYKIRDNFIANNEFGLDTYLSMRIRHGTLVGELRSVFEKYFLITKKDSNSEDYIDNIYWKKIDFIDEEKQVALNEALSNFSRAVDTLSNHFKNEVIQIKTEIKNSGGYFDYLYSDKELHTLFKYKFGAISDTHVFIDEVIGELWNRTEINLERIRNYINNVLKNNIIDELLELSRKVEALMGYNKPYELLGNITTCQTELRNELDKISSWFKRTHNKSINDFKIELPIYLTTTTISRLYKNFNTINLKTQINFDKNFDGEYFQHFCYIFQNLIHNILEHSKLDFEKLVICIDVFEENDSLTVIFTNNISENIDLSLLNNTIDDINDKVNKTAPVGDMIREESGTGYLKILKTIRYDLKCKGYDIIIDKVDNHLIFTTKIIIRDKHMYV